MSGYIGVDRKERARPGARAAGEAYGQPTQPELGAPDPVGREVRSVRIARRATLAHVRFGADRFGEGAA